MPTAAENPDAVATAPVCLCWIEPAVILPIFNLSPPFLPRVPFLPPFPSLSTAVPFLPFDVVVLDPGSWVCP